MKLSLNKYQLCCIIKRFRSKLKYRNGLPMYEQNKISNKEDISLLEAYKIQCVYSNSTNVKRENLVLKYTCNNEVILLNILLDEYKDLIQN